jgi:phosphomannomutase
MSSASLAGQPVAIYKLDDEVEKCIEDIVFSGEIENIRPTATKIGKAFRIDDALGRYVEFAKQSFPRGRTLDSLRIAVDCANGAAYKSTPCILRELGAETHVVHNAPNGTNTTQTAAVRSRPRSRELSKRRRLMLESPMTATRIACFSATKTVILWMVTRSWRLPPWIY